MRFICATLYQALSLSPAGSTTSRVTSQLISSAFDIRVNCSITNARSQFGNSIIFIGLREVSKQRRVTCTIRILSKKMHVARASDAKFRRPVDMYDRALGKF